ncbi:unnamed protein product [Closterium sp. NIES-53]
MVIQFHIPPQAQRMGVRVLSRRSWLLHVPRGREATPLCIPNAPQASRDAMLEKQIGADLKHLQSALNAAPRCNKGEDIKSIKVLGRAGLSVAAAPPPRATAVAAAPASAAAPDGAAMTPHLPSPAAAASTPAIADVGPVGATLRFAFGLLSVGMHECVHRMPIVNITAANLISVRWLQKAGMDTSSRGAKTYTARLGEWILWDLHEDRDVYNEMWQIHVVPVPKERQVAANISTKGEAVGSGDGTNGRAKEIKSKKCNLGGTSKLGEHEGSGAAAKKQHKDEENHKTAAEEE